MNPLNREILRLSLPNIIVNITVPLLGMVDLAIVGHIGDASYIGGIALGTMIFNIIYFNFSFLRMGTSGYTAQAFGAGNMEEALRILVRGLAIAFSSAVILLFLQKPIAMLASLVLEGSKDTLEYAYTYFYVRIWAAPATLGLYTFKGWFLGMQNARIPMIIEIVLNSVNVLFSLLFVFVFHMGIAGVALGTVLAQYSGLLLAAFFWLKYYRNIAKVDLRSSLEKSALLGFFKVNGDIFLRSFCLLAVFTFIPVISYKSGDEILAANTVLMQLFSLFSFFMDGFAFAAEAMVGRFIGERDSISLHISVKYLMRWGWALTALFTLIYIVAGNGILSLLTDDNPTVMATSAHYLKWMLIVPVAGFGAFLYDGIYVGATASRAMLYIMFAATVVFFTTFFILNGIAGNDGLWIAFLLFLFCRSILMWWRCDKILYEDYKNK